MKCCKYCGQSLEHKDICDYCGRNQTVLQESEQRRRQDGRHVLFQAWSPVLGPICLVLCIAVCCGSGFFFGQVCSRVWLDRFVALHAGFLVGSLVWYVYRKIRGNELSDAGFFCYCLLFCTGIGFLFAYASLV